MKRALAEKMFAYILIFGQGNDPVSLWERFRAHLIEDYTRRYHMKEDAATARALCTEHSGGKRQTFS